jgi:hypothetical protein
MNIFILSLQPKAPALWHPARCDPENQLDQG